jgi:hypothetical protein
MPDEIDGSAVHNDMPYVLPEMEIEYPTSFESSRISLWLRSMGNEDGGKSRFHLQMTEFVNITQRILSFFAGGGSAEGPSGVRHDLVSSCRVYCMLLDYGCIVITTRHCWWFERELEAGELSGIAEAVAVC